MEKSGYFHCGECEEQITCRTDRNGTGDEAVFRFVMRKVNDRQEYLCVECAEKLGIMGEFAVKGGGRDAGK